MPPPGSPIFGTLFGKSLFFFPLLAGWFFAGDFQNSVEGKIDMPVVSSPVGLLNADRAATIGESILLAVVLGGSIWYMGRAYGEWHTG